MKKYLKKRLVKESRSVKTGNNIFWSEVISLLRSNSEGRELLNEDIYTRSMVGITDESFANDGAFAAGDFLDSNSYYVIECYDFIKNDDKSKKCAVFMAKLNPNNLSNESYTIMGPTMEICSGDSEDILGRNYYNGYMLVTNVTSPEAFLRRMMALRKMNGVD